MIPADVDASFLSGQLADGAVAFTSPDLVDPVLRERLSAVVEGESTAVVVAGPGSGAEMRNAGQAVLDATDFSTVIVRGPDAAAAVSEEYSRAALESPHLNLVAEPDYVVGVREFLVAAESFSVNWTAASVVAAVLVVAAAVCAWAAARTVKPQPLNE